MFRTVTVSSPAMPSLLGAQAFEFMSMNGAQRLGELFCYIVELQTPDNPLLDRIALFWDALGNLVEERNT